MKKALYILSIILILIPFSVNASWIMIVENNESGDIVCPQELHALNIEKQGNGGSVSACVPLSVLDKPPEYVIPSDENTESEQNTSNSDKEPGPLVGPQFN